MSSQMKVALYARVSTDDKGQTNKTQLDHLHRFIEFENSRGKNLSVYKEYTDEASGKSIHGRPGYQALIRDAVNKKFDIVMAYKLDRFHRNTLSCIEFVDSLGKMGIDLVITSQSIDTSTAAGRAMMQIIAVFAELESANTSERVKIGMERARSEGKVCHAPTKVLSDYHIKKAKEILASNPGISQRKLAE